MRDAKCFFQLEFLPYPRFAPVELIVEGALARARTGEYSRTTLRLPNHGGPLLTYIDTRQRLRREYAALSDSRPFNNRMKAERTKARLDRKIQKLGNVLVFMKSHLLDYLLTMQPLAHLTDQNDFAIVKPEQRAGLRESIELAGNVEVMKINAELLTSDSIKIIYRV